MFFLAITFFGPHPGNSLFCWQSIAFHLDHVPFLAIKNMVPSVAGYHVCRTSSCSPQAPSSPPRACSFQSHAAGGEHPRRGPRRSGPVPLQAWTSRHHTLNYVGPRWWPDVVGPEVCNTRLQILGVAQQDQVWGVPSLCTLPKAMGDQFPRNWATLYWWHSQLKAICADNGHWASYQRTKHPWVYHAWWFAVKPCLWQWALAFFLVFHCHHHVGCQERCVVIFGNRIYSAGIPENVYKPYLWFKKWSGVH